MKVKWGDSSNPPPLFLSVDLKVFWEVEIEREGGGTLGLLWLFRLDELSKAVKGGSVFAMVVYLDNGL
ncbi:hypothetical protein LIER_01626 [Lithospermum erythrorhizon]|uniref:Uncharacterized protein n=1 Tax=Lithospermum erythrorhizon TaxID=34254 RepID=A0AAV3NML4_LITER